MTPTLVSPERFELLTQAAADPVLVLSPGVATLCVGRLRYVTPRVPAGRS